MREETEAKLDGANTPPSGVEMERLITQVILSMGEDPNRPGLLKTPARVAESLRFLTGGHRVDVQALMHSAMFEAEDCHDMVIVKNIEFYSLCEHHMLPIAGQVHIGYLPNKHIIGLSKVARLVDVFARRLQVQERMTRQIGACLYDTLDAKGVGIVVEAVHFCMVMRGVQKQSSKTLTSSMLGHFLHDQRTRSEFMGLLNGY